jgi:hypothetical protein
MLTCLVIPSHQSILHAPATPDCFARHDLPATNKSNRHKNYEEAGLNFFYPNNFKPLTPLFATHPKNALITLLFATLPKTPVLKVLCLPHIQKMAGWGVLLLTRNPRKDLCSLPMSANSRMDTITRCRADRGGHGIREYSLQGCSSNQRKALSTHTLY